ncbi:aromatic ring-hydroxylating dioxygenase subunit alpha [Variovorax sp. PBL-E5]|uniref:aromatic ring-hydroxylating dioxygenase subunit alpha n=1 Tax=Variovorax sp. PBL-E5 TaxID=434014 RepID=UPI001316F347|nr:aromatic ring-hydroxylating dioxygenase subunit alpha [Variovorax sp. PBL-E5]VTU45168.1 Toluene-4-sulfonate monooxygenase system iron-sulfur subunit TsaM1 [Variovorax sp. PBL-E5]
MFLRNCWYVAGWLEDVASDAVVARTIIGDNIVLYRKSDGALVALQDRCCHRHAPLSLGRREGDDLRCMYHGLKFNPSGQCIEVPGQDRIPPKACVRSYPVAQAGAWIWVWMGDPARASEDLIPRGLIGPAQTDWIYGQDAMAYEAFYELINDNLLDLSHLSYVHEKTLGRQSLQWGETRPAVTPIERGLRVERWLVDDRPPRHIGAPDDARFDRWTAYDYLAPGIFLLTSEYHALGTAKASGMAKPSARPRHVNMTQQAVVPVTARRSIYYFTAGHRAQDTYDGRVPLQVAAVVNAFQEDRTMIEAQQRVIDASVPSPMVLTSADAAVSRFRRIMQALIEEEAHAA